MCHKNGYQQLFRFIRLQTTLFAIKLSVTMDNLAAWNAMAFDFT